MTVRIRNVPITTRHRSLRPNAAKRDKRGPGALRTVLDWTPRWAYTFDPAGKRFPGSLICEGETDGFETT